MVSGPDGAFDVCMDRWVDGLVIGAAREVGRGAPKGTLSLTQLGSPIIASFLGRLQIGVRCL